MKLWLKVNFAFTFIKTLTVKKCFNSALLRFSYWLSKIVGKQFVWGNPESLSVEPTNLCNLKCPECPSGTNNLNRPRLFLSLNVFKNIIDECYKNLVYLQLYFQGEPFMHPKMGEFISYACKRNIFTSTATNGHFLTTDNCKTIVNSGLHQIIISIDGTTQDVFEKYRIGGSLDQVLQGIENLQNAKKEYQSRTPHIVIQFVVFKQNEHQINEIKNLAKQLNITDVRLKSGQIENFEWGSELMPTNEKFQRYKKDNSGKFHLKRRQNFKCYRIWSGAVVSANNELLPCCFDKTGEYSYGNIENGSLLAIWKNKEAFDFKNEVWQNYKQFKMCLNCTEGVKKTWFK